MVCFLEFYDLEKKNFPGQNEDLIPMRFKPLKHAMMSISHPAACTKML